MRLSYVRQGEEKAPVANARGESMAPAAPHGKPRCWVSQGVWCLKVHGV